MRIFVDENIPCDTVGVLRDMGHDVLDIRGTQQEGGADDVLWREAQEQKRLFITTDKGFAHCRFEKHYGILVVRLKQPNLQKIHDRIIQAVKNTPPEDWPGLLLIFRDITQSAWRLPV